MLFEPILDHFYDNVSNLMVFTDFFPNAFQNWEELSKLLVDRRERFFSKKKFYIRLDDVCDCFCRNSFKVSHQGKLAVPHRFLKLLRRILNHINLKVDVFSVNRVELLVAEDVRVDLKDQAGHL